MNLQALTSDRADPDFLVSLGERRLPLDETAFADALREAVKFVRAEDTRLFRVFNSGRCPVGLLREFALNTVASAQRFCRLLPALIERAPSAEAKLILIENLHGESGVRISKRNGLTIRHEVSHPGLAERFAAAVGVEPDGRRPDDSTDLGITLLEAGHWLEAIAYLLVGLELPYANAGPAIAKALMRNGLRERDVAFFIIHGTEDRSHGEQAIAMVVSFAKTREEQERCIELAREGGIAWMRTHGGPIV